MRSRTASPLLHVVAFALLASFACNPSTDPPLPAPASISEDAAAAAPLVGDDAGGEGDDAALTGYAALEASSFDPENDAGWGAASPEASAGPPGDSVACPAPVGPGDLVVDEMMIESVAGTGDYGQWIEIASTRPCALNLVGLHGECANGAKVRVFDVGYDLWLPPGGTLVVADSADPAIDHDLPGLVLTWSGSPGDVLRKNGGTLTLLAGGVLVDTLTWPAYKGAIGASVELPADCPPEDVADFTYWQQATTSWFPGFLGTPNAPNDDVQCQ